MVADEVAHADRQGSILIAEDERVVARSIERTLTEAGYEVTGTASSVQETLDRLKRSSPDLLLLDIGLVEADDGIRLAESVDVPILFVSGRSDAETLRRAGSTSALGFVVKPFGPRQLLASVELALARASTPEHRALEKARRALTDIAQTLERAGYPGASASASGLRIRAVPGLERLTNREQEVLDALLAYQRPPQIAEQLFISPHTVRNHLKSIYAKLGVHSQAELLDLLVERG
jgi:DNA-binding NarL/FixJ family response regulator